jgi:hypothetical protein
MDSHCFEHQFQPWFDPKAHQARWRRIERVAGLLEGYANVGNLLLNPDQHAWRHGDPVGIEADSTTFDPTDRDLALAYAHLAVPISLPTDWKIPDKYSLLDAHRALLDDIQGPPALRTVFPIIDELPENHYDGLTFTTIRPHYSEHRYNADGT